MMTPEISLLEAELVKSCRHRLQAAKDAYWTDHFNIVEGETVVIAKNHYGQEQTCVIRWTNRHYRYPCMIRRKKDGSAIRNPGMPSRLKEIVKCFSNS